jgi:hypothetical protein
MSGRAQRMFGATDMSTSVFIAIFAVLGTALFVYAASGATLEAAAMGFILGSVVGIALKAFPFDLTPGRAGR